jgi:hypothetical protein
MMIVFDEEVLKRVCLGITCKIVASDSDVRSIQRLWHLHKAVLPDRGGALSLAEKPKIILFDLTGLRSSNPFGKALRGAGTHRHRPV